MVIDQQPIALSHYGSAPYARHSHSSQAPLASRSVVPQPVACSPLPQLASAGGLALSHAATRHVLATAVAHERHRPRCSPRRCMSRRSCLHVQLNMAGEMTYGPHASVTGASRGQRGILDNTEIEWPANGPDRSVYNGTFFS